MAVGGILKRRFKSYVSTWVLKRLAVGRERRCSHGTSVDGDVHAGGDVLRHDASSPHLRHRNWFGKKHITFSDMMISVRTIYGLSGFSSRRRRARCRKLRYGSKTVRLWPYTSRIDRKSRAKQLSKYRNLSAIVANHLPPSCWSLR